MKYLGIAVIMLALVGCSNTPSKLERIEANEAAISASETAILELQTRPDPVVDTSCPASCNEKIDRAFEKSQYK